MYDREVAYEVFFVEGGRAKGEKMIPRVLS